MKVMAVGKLNAPLTDEQRKQVMPREVPHTLQMYLDGKIEQFWFRANTGPVFLMSADSPEAAKAMVDGMPLVELGLAAYEFWPLSPLMPLRMLLPNK
jgi:hypothetical protein